MELIECRYLERKSSVLHHVTLCESWFFLSVDVISSDCGRVAMRFVAFIGSEELKLKALDIILASTVVTVDAETSLLSEVVLVLLEVDRGIGLESADANKGLTDL